MSIPATAFTFKSFAQVAPGQLFRWRDVWVMKSSYMDTQNGNTITPIGVILTGTTLGHWEPEPRLPTGRLATLADGWTWRAEIEGVEAIEEGDSIDGSLLYLPQGLAIAATFQVWGCFAGLDGQDHYQAVGYTRRQPRATQWKGFLVAPDSSSTWPLFSVSANAE
ncbi:hypothetical protein H4W19_01530 [Pseudoxanthomonas mexicana]|uniref:Uncharacterized protein n=1 Tax=Pseudoxanthomonas mexicana TaxID=128785 RepID=A0ABX6RD92_PSEMX|nr:hypothetical protein [Pseudoxanthomonas mexicana]QND80514.1 hypothetical protein H4W19_01530 [Pseudoxanthomonas mexicana]